MSIGKMWDKLINISDIIDNNNINRIRFLLNKKIDNF